MLAIRRGLSWPLLPAVVVVVAVCVPTRHASAWAPLDACRPVWTAQPSQYHMNEDGYTRIPLDTLRTIMRASFDAWSEPCCSTWSAREAGVTSGVGEDGANAQHIVSFRESSWPRELGDAGSTLAVTLTRWSVDGRGRCGGLTADMIFNAANHVFGTSHSRSTTDLQAVATHEAGHWLGLGHSSVSTATMKPVYSNEEDRSLHADDESGVCSLYPGDCRCTTDSDCTDGRTCVSGQCEERPCTSDGDCASGLACDTSTGVCVVPPCRSDDDCLGSQQCVSGSCVASFDCPTCSPCTTSDDCGGVWQCATDGTGGGLCTRICTTSADCPGNSECFAIEGESFAVCLNDDAGSAGVCPTSYVCEVDDVCAGVVCDGGQTCDPATGRCVTPAVCDVCTSCSSDDACGDGTCWTFDAGSFCAPTCTRDSDCPATTRCFTFGASSGGTVAICMNDDLETNGVCPASYTCGETEDACAGVTCRDGQRCDPATGRCVSAPDAGGTDTGGSDAGRDGGAGDATTTDAVDRDAAGRDTSAQPDMTSGGDASTGGDGIEGCGICAPCDATTACPGSAVCTAVGDAGSVCTIDCSANAGVCPSDTACFEVAIAGEVRNLCLNADAAAAGICPVALSCGGGLPPFVLNNSQRGCAAAPSPTMPPGSLLLGVALAVLALRQRRRNPDSLRRSNP